MTNTATKTRPVYQDTVLAVLPRTGGEIHICHRETAQWHDALAVVGIRPGFPDFSLVIHVRNVGALREALDQFEERLREKASRERAALGRAGVARRRVAGPGVPSGRKRTAP